MDNNITIAESQPRKRKIIIDGSAILIQAEILRNDVMACVEVIKTSEKGRKFLDSKYVNTAELRHLVDINDIYDMGHMVDLNTYYEIFDQTKQDYFLLEFGGYVLIPDEQIADLLAEVADKNIRIHMELAKLTYWSLREVLEDTWFFKILKGNQ